MNGFQFRPAIREAVSLLIGIIGPSGGGKTFTAMRLAKGICGDKPFVIIDTEAGRAKHYADIFRFDHGDLKPPFRPDTYAGAIKVADESGYKAIIVDSVSHEWAGDGGILDWQEEELTRMAGEDWKKREACKMASWIKPKMAHKQMIQRLLQVRANLILCFRAEEKNAIEKDNQGRMVIIPRGWQPVCSKEMPYELTVSFLLLPDNPGVPHPIKLQEQHKELFPLNQQINETSGKKISEWATGKKPGENENIDSESDLPSPEEEKQLLEERGMIPTTEEPKDKKMEETTILNEMAKIVAKFTLKKELMSWYNENRKSLKEKYSQIFFVEWTKLVNDKLEKLR